MGCRRYKTLNSDTFIYTFYCIIPLFIEKSKKQKILISNQYNECWWQLMFSFFVEVQLRSQFSFSSRRMPLSAVTQSTKTALDPFVCFIYSDCSQQLTWDSIYPCLALLIDPFVFFSFNGSAVTWKNEFDLKSDTEAHGN